MSETKYTRDQIKSAIWQELKEHDYTGENNDRAYEVIGIVMAGIDKINTISAGLPPLTEPILTDEDVKDWEAEKRRPGVAWKPDFIEFIKNERKAIAKEMLNDEWWLTIPAAKRVAVENMLIAYDQMVSRICKGEKHGAVFVKASDRLPKELGPYNGKYKGSPSVIHFNVTNIKEPPAYWANVEWLDESGTAAGREEVLQRIKDFNLADIDAPVFTHTKEFATHFSYIKGKLMDILKAEGVAAGREEDWIGVEDRPLIRRDGEWWGLTEDGEKEFIAAVPYRDAATDDPEKVHWWIRHCYIDGEGFLYVKRDNEMDEDVAGWAVSDITHWRPLPAPPKFKQQKEK